MCGGGGGRERQRQGWRDSDKTRQTNARETAGTEIETDGARVLLPARVLWAGPPQRTLLRKF